MVLLIFIILGLACGSFVNALVWRVHEQSKLSKKQSSASKAKLSILTGRSMCIHCHHTLAWYDLLPVVGWLLLGGKCRHCKKPISPQYPLVELLTAGLFVLSYFVWFDGLTLVTGDWQLATLSLWLITLTGLIALAIYDLKWMLLPNRILFPLYIPAVAYALIRVLSSDSPLTTFYQLLFAIAIGGGIFWLLYQISKGKWIGGGDVKLGFLLGLIVIEPVYAVATIVLASLLGTIIALPLIATGRSKLSGKLPFGPLLIVSAVTMVLYGEVIVDWYLSLFLLG